MDKTAARREALAEQGRQNARDRMQRRVEFEKKRALREAARMKSENDKAAKTAALQRIGFLRAWDKNNKEIYEAYRLAGKSDEEIEEMLLEQKKKTYLESFDEPLDEEALMKRVKELGITDEEIREWVDG